MSSNIEYIRATKHSAQVSAVVNFLLGTLKIIAGFFGHSSALLADGIHSLADLAYDGLILITAKYIQAPPDHNHPYGHERFETFTTFILGISLLSVGLLFIYDSYLTVQQEHLFKPDWYTLVLAMISILSNEFLFRYIMSTAEKIDSDLLRASAWHNRADSLTSVVVMISLIGAFYGWHFLDKIATIIIGLYIAKIGCSYLLDIFKELSEEGVGSLEKQKIIDIIRSVEGVISTHELRTRFMAKKLLIDAHVQVSPYISASEGHYITDQVKFELIAHLDNIKDVIIHLDTSDDSEYHHEISLPSRQYLAKQVNMIFADIIPPQSLKELQIYYLEDHIELLIILTEEAYNEFNKHNLKAQIESIEVVTLVQTAVTYTQRE